MASNDARRRIVDEWNRTVGPFYPRLTLIRDLRITEAELDELIERGEVLRLQRGDHEFFPAFQFAVDGARLPGLGDIRAKLNPTRDADVDWSVTLWLCRRRPEYDWANAAELLRAGRLGEVIERAAALSQTYGR